MIRVALVLWFALCLPAVGQDFTAEMQSWWSAQGVEPGPASTHVHIRTTLPIGTTVSGVISFDITAIVHHPIPGSKLRSTKVYSEPLHKVMARIDWNQTLGGEVNWSSGPRTVTFDTRNCAYDGRQEFRLLTDMVDGHGNAQVVTSGLQVITKNGLPIKHARAENWNEARSYYVTGYQNARFLSPIPNAPISGIWSPYIQITDGSGGRPTDRHQILLDAADHGHIPGRVLRDSAGRFAKQRFPIDTTTLTPGPHKLFLVGHEFDDANSDPTRHGTVSVVLVIPFVVQ